MGFLLNFLSQKQGVTMDHILPWLILKDVPGVGNHLFKRLIDKWQSPQNVLEQPVNDLLTLSGISPKIAKSIDQQHSTDKAHKEIDRAFKRGIKIICMDDPSYPPLLKQIPDPPPVLYIYGEFIPSDICISIVGARNATLYGETMTHTLAKELASNQITIVSGMARGIDTAAHKGAIDVNGRTIAVMGCGLEIVYPGENRDLFHAIGQKNGAVISEFPMQAKPETYHFPQRNRIISGMSMGTIVVEAGRKSGSLITARLALEQDRHVFAVPGPVNSEMTIGTHKLIKQGAKLVENAKDVLEDLGPFLNYHLKQHHETKIEKPTLPKMNETEKTIWEQLTLEPQHIDILLEKLDMTLQTLSAQLLQMELAGLVKQHPGKRFSKDTFLRK